MQLHILVKIYEHSLGIVKQSPSKKINPVNLSVSANKFMKHAHFSPRRIRKPPNGRFAEIFCRFQRRKSSLRSLCAIHENYNLFLTAASGH